MARAFPTQSRRRTARPLQTPIERLEDRSTPATIAYAGGTYANHFDWLPASGAFTLNVAGPYWFDGSAPAGSPLGFGTATGNNTAAGWQLFRNAGSATRFAVDDGGSLSGSAYSYGAVGATDRALGSLASASSIAAYGATFTNTSSATTFTEFTVTAYREQWRRGSVTGNPSPEAQAFQWAAGAASIASGTYTAVPAGNLTAAATGGGSGVGNLPVNGNSTSAPTADNPYRKALTFTVTGLTWAPGENLSIRWVDTDVAGSDDGYGIDDLTFTAATSVPPAPPALTGRANAAATEGVRGTFALAATGSPAPTFALSGAPSWVAVDAATGVLSFDPPALARNETTRSYTFDVTAANGQGTATRPFTLYVVPAPEAAVPFTPGNLVVYRVGDGGTTYGADGSGGTTGDAAAAVFLDEYTPAGAFVQTAFLPITGADRLTDSLSSLSGGLLTRSADGRLLAVPGFRAAPGTAGVMATTAAAVPRVVQFVRPDGTLGSSISTTAYDGGPVRGAATVDGRQVYAAGAGTDATAGVRYYDAPGSATAAAGVRVTNTADTRGVSAADGRLLFAAAADGRKPSLPATQFNFGRGVYRANDPLPTTNPDHPVDTGLLAAPDPMSGEPHQFAVLDMNASGGLDAGDRLYFTDAAVGSAGVWRADYVPSVGEFGAAVQLLSAPVAGLRGLTARAASPGVAELFVTAAETTFGDTTSFAAGLYALADAAPVAAAAARSVVPTPLVRLADPGGPAAPVRQFRGVAFVPTPAGANPTAVAVTAPDGALAGSPVTFTAAVSRTAGDGTPTGYVSFLDPPTGRALSTARLDPAGRAAYTFTPADSGVYAVDVVYGGSDADAPSSGSGSVTVAGGTAPTITGTLADSAIPGEAGTFRITATGDPAPTFRLADQPGWVTIDAATGVLSFAVPDDQPAGEVTFTVIAENGVAPAASRTFTLTVLPPPAFAAGNVVVVKVGRSDATTAVALKEFTPAGALTTTVALPAAGPGDTLTLVGTAAGEGHLARSLDGRTLSLAGYRQAAGGATAGVNRVVARVGPAAAIDLSTQLPADVGVVRATASADGLGYYLATSSGVRYVPFGSPADGATLLSPLDAGPDDLGGVLVGPDGRLYALRSAGGPALVGAGLPIVGGQTIMPLPGFPDGAGIEPGEFVLNPAGTTIYLADARTDGNGGLVRYQLVNGQWTETAAYRFPAAGLRALTADFTGVSPVVYGVTAEASAAANRLVRFSDAGGSSIAAPTVLATAAADTAFRGVALSPVAAGAVTTTTTLTAGATSGVYGTGVTLTARVSGRAGPRGPGGVVSFRAGGREIGAAVLVNGSATFATVGNLPASATPADVVAVYTGDPTYAGSTSAARSVTITKAATSTTLAASPNPAVQGTDVVLTAALTVPAGTLPTGTVTFRAGADVLGTAPVVVVVEGRSILFRAALTVRFVTPGDRTLTAEYGGDGNFQPGTSDGLVQSVTAAAGAIAFGAAGFDAIADPGTVYLTLTRTGGTAGAVTVEGYTADGTAAAGTDFVGILPGAPFTVSFADGQTTALLPVTLLLPPAPYAGTRTFTVTLQSPTGGATLGGRSSAAVTLTDPVLRVVSKPVVDGSSIRLNFNRKVDPGPVNLYAGPADLVVLDAGTGQPSAAVAGSLVLDPGGTTATFVNTAGAVPAGSYRVRLAADADGRPAFRGLDGRALDGDGDDAPGGDFTSAALDVAAPAGPVLAVGGFARGAGQAVQLPVTIRGAGTVTQVSFQLAYDPTLLTVPATGAVTLAGGTGMTLGPYSVTVLDARRAVLAVSAAGGAGWNPPDGAAVVTVAASVPDDALYGGAAVLDLGTVQVNDAQAVAADGVHAAAYPGDADADRAYSALDAALIARSGGGVGLAAFDDLDPVLIGDLDGDGVMDPELVARRAVGQTVPQLPDRPAGAAPAPTGTGPKLYFADAVARPGGTVTVSLRLAVADPAGFPLAALDLAVGFDPAVLSVGNVRGGSLFGAAADWTTVAAVDNGAGVLRVGLFTARPLDLTQGKDGEVLRFDVTVRAATPVGTTTPLNLLAAAGPTATDRTVTAVGRTAGLRLPDPAPTDGSDVGVDGLVSVVAEANRPPTVTARDVGTGRPSRLLFNPADAPGLRTAAANTFPFAGADAITVDDPDGGSVTVTVGLTGAAGPVGVLTATAAGAATVTGNGTEAVTIAGPLADVNATLGSLVYRPGAGYFGRTAVTASADDGAGGTAAAATAVEAVGLFVSEVMLGPANVWAMGPYQYVEVFSTAPDYDIPAGVYLVGVEGDNGGAATNDPGRVQDVFALGPVGAQPGFRTGPNGYLALLPKAAGYEAAVRDPAGVVAENAGTGGGFGNGGGSSAYPTPGGPKAGVHAGPSAGGARDGSPANEGTGNLERASASYLLVRTAAAPTSATDIDPGNDGVPDGGAYDGWTVLDGVAVLDGVNGTAGPDRAYAPVVFRSSSSNGTAPAGAAVVETHAPGNQWVGGPWTATYAGRVGRSTGYAAADWLAAVADQARGAIRLHSLRSTAFAGQVLAHVGGPNFFAPTATVVVNDGRSAQRSLVSSVAVRFDLPVAVADPGAFRLRTAGGVYLDIIVTDAATGRPLAAGATGVREVRLAPRPGSPFTVAFARPDPWGYSVGLADGNYFVEVRADAVTANGVRLDGDRDGSAGGDLSAQVFRFFGDVNGDRYVDRVDDGRFGAAFGGKPTDPADPVFFDVNQDGVLDATDRAAFLKNRARNLPPA